MHNRWSTTNHHDCKNGRVIEEPAKPEGAGWPDEGTPRTGDGGHFRAGARLIAELVSRQRMNFAIAVTGAAVFATFTAGSSLGIRWMIDHVIVPRFERGDVAWSTVLTGCVLVVVISLVRAAGVVVRRTFAGKAEWGVAERVSMEVIERYGRQPVSWHDRHSTGDLVSRAGVDVDTSVAVLAPLPYGSSVVLLLVISAAGLMVTDVALGLVAIVVLPLLVLANVFYQRRVDAHFEEAQKEMGALSGAVLESFEGVAVVKAFGAEERETRRLSLIAGRLRDARIKSVRARATFEMALDGVPSVANLALLLVGAMRVKSGNLSVGELASSMYLFTLLVVPLRLIGYVFSELPHSKAGWTRVKSIMDEPLEVDPRAVRSLAPPGLAVVLEKVRIAHDGNVVLPDVTLSIPQGRHTAIVGATGSGKTTLLRAIAGTVPLTGGSVSVAGGSVGYAQQEPFIFSESARFNLCLGASIAEEVISEALHVADAAFLADLDGGLDASLGERGVSLSGGQRQRLSLARELVHSPRVLLLDDTTSALDPQTELRVLDNLRRTSLVETIVMVASRPSTIAAASAVVFIDQSRVVHDSTHAELIESHEEYRRLIEAFEDDRSPTEGTA